MEEFSFFVLFVCLQTGNCLFSVMRSLCTKRYEERKELPTASAGSGGLESEPDKESREVVQKLAQLLQCASWKLASGTHG